MFVCLYYISTEEDEDSSVVWKEGGGGCCVDHEDNSDAMIYRYIFIFYRMEGLPLFFFELYVVGRTRAT